MREAKLICPACGEEMTLQELDFYLCGNCAGEYWPNDDPMYGLAEAMREDMNRGARSKGRGSRSKRTKKKAGPLSIERYRLY